MSTKGLMAHKRVAEVTLNEAGKAATLTLAPGWLYEGSRGPFTLVNVEHGHKIVKGAVSDGSVPLAVRSPPKRSLPTTDGPEPKHSTNPDYVSPLDRPAPRTHEAFIYRLALVERGKSPKEGRDRFAWLQMTEPLPDDKLNERAWSMLRGYHGPELSEDTHEAQAFRWTNAHQDLARKAGEIGSPWAGKVNHG